jgi:2-polyprenyl-6-hydroxyphenyl methylase/3-demethylubiquinone-9 3-methyltransferase
MKKLKWRVAQWFEIRWWKNYLHGKNKQEYLAWKKNYWLNILEKITDVAPVDANKTVCDLGCGPAGIFIALPDNKVTAVDPLINRYENISPVFCKADYPNAQFVESTIEDFTGSQKFDIVFCMNCINHVSDIDKGFDKLKEVCADNGTVVVSIDAHNFSLFKFLFRLIPGDVLHPHQYDLQEYKSFLEKRGLKILKTELLKQEFLFGHWVLVGESVSN